MSTRILILMAILCGVGLLACPALAETVADFTGGNNNTTIVDAYEGIPGLGWTTPWEENYNTLDYTATNTVLSPGDTGYDELCDGPYLSSTVGAGTTATDVRFGVGREHGTIDETVLQQHIEFCFRIDEDVDGEDSTFTEYQDRYVIEDGEAGVNTPSSHATWEIFGYGGEGTNCPAASVREWTFIDGNNSPSGSTTGVTWVDTDIKLVKGGVYEFAVDFYPALGTWDCEVTHVNATYSPNTFKETGMGWRDSEINGDYIYFMSRTYGSDDVRAFSVDCIEITAIPEPGAILLLVMGLAMLAIRRVRR